MGWPRPHLSAGKKIRRTSAKYWCGLRITDSGAGALLRVRSKRTEWLARRVAALTPRERATLHEAALILQEMSA